MPRYELRQVQIASLIFGFRIWDRRWARFFGSMMYERERAESIVHSLNKAEDYWETRGLTLEDVISGVD